MSRSQGMGTGTPNRPKTAALSRHWKVAVLAAAGFVTMVGTTTLVGVADAGAAEAQQPAAAPRDGFDPDSEGGGKGDDYSGSKDNGDKGDDYSGSKDKGDKGDDYSGSKDKGDKGDDYSGSKDKGDKGDKGSEEKDYGSKGDEGKEKDSGSKGDEGKEKDSGDHDKEKDSGDHDKEKYSGDRNGHDKKHGRKHEGGHGKAVFVECDVNDLILAITEANDEEGATHLRLANDCTYTLTANQDGNGLPKIVQPISIDGNGSTIARAANAELFRLFEVGSGGDLKLRNLTLTRGKAAVAQDGGAISVNAAGRLELDHVTLKNNTVEDIGGRVGGAVFNEGDTSVRNSTFKGNSAADGSAIFNAGGRLEVADSEFTKNTAVADGAINSELGTATIHKSVVSNNFGSGLEVDEGGLMVIEKSEITHNTDDGTGGGIDQEVGAGLQVRKSTISDNFATEDGGGLQLDEDALIEDSKITDNTSTNADAGGIDIEDEGNGEVAIRDSKVSGNQAPANGQNGGGIFVDTDRTLTLTDTEVTENLSDEPAGGIQNNGTVNTNGKVRIIDNVPTNCDGGGGNPVPNCFG
ncbi:right-handed parallel beta-helix repeat-containing protein [Streptomyces sp. NPDC057445]|uniref:right-handed parallel beta-helix repeat-containing protein n=1 Tax=Streptomyces sp. NPDC057445 TaxID=3346136 RepID=UPI0036AF7E11